MADIIRTWPASAKQKVVAEMFALRPRWCRYYFTLGRGTPKQSIERLWFTYQGRILGSFGVDEIVCNVGQLPKLHSIDDEDSEWQIPKDAWVAICTDFTRAKARVFMDGFRGWRYFDFEAWKATPDSKHRLG